MPITQVQSTQIRTQAAQANLGLAVDDSLVTILNRLNTEADVPFRISQTSTPNLVVNLGASKVSKADGRQQAQTPQSNTLLSFTSGIITFNLTSTAITAAPGGSFTLPTIAAGQFVNVGVSIKTDGNINLSFGNVVASLAALSQPGNAPVFATAEFPVGIIQLTRIGANLAGANPTAASGQIENKDLIQFVGAGAGGAGDSEEALLFNNLALNNMEAGMMTSFIAGKENFVRTTANMTLNGDGNYVPSSSSTNTFWIGNRRPNEGATTEAWTFSGLAPASVNTLTGEMTITDLDGPNKRSYAFALPSGVSTGDVFVEYECKTITETTAAAYGTDVSFYSMVGIRDGAWDIRAVFIRQGSSSGARQLVIGSSTTTVANDLDTGAALRIAVDWSQYHTYKLYKRGTVLYVYVDDVYQGRVDITTLQATASLDCYFGVENSISAAGIHVWKRVHLNAYRSSLETKTLNYRGTFAYEGDGDPTSATVPALSVNDPATGYLLENNWVQWVASSSGSVVETQLNAGLPESSRQLAVSPSSGRHYTAPIVGGADAQNVSIQAEVVFSAMNLGTGTAFNMLNFRVANIRAQLWCSKVSLTSVLVGIGNLSGPAASGVGVGGPVIVGLNEVNVYELRKVGRDVIQFLFNGKIQQEIRVAEFDFNHPSSSTDVFWGNSTPIGAADSFTWRWDFVRCTYGKDSFLPRASVREFLAIANHEDSDPYVSFTSDNITWTYPVKLNDLGVSSFVTTSQQRSGGYVAAKIMLAASSGSLLSSLSVLYNAALGLNGLAAEAVKTYTALELPSAPQDAIFNHGLGVAEDEIIVFGGTEHLIKNLDWFYSSANSILIVGAQVGVPYVVKRVGFSFDRSADNSERLTLVEGRTTILEGRTISAGNGLTGGGDLTANRTLTLSTPSTITSSSLNQVTVTSHTHALSLSSTDIGLLTASLGTTTTGSYVFAAPEPAGVTTYNLGEPVGGLAGSSLRQCSGGSTRPGSGSLPGNWRCMGYSTPAGSAASTLWKRIS